MDDTRLELVTSTMSTCGNRVLTDNLSDVATTLNSRCTNGCTSESENHQAPGTEAHPQPTTGAPSDFTAALAMIAALPLSGAEKAEAVRRLLKRKDERP